MNKQDFKVQANQVIEDLRNKIEDISRIAQSDDLLIQDELLKLRNKAINILFLVSDKLYDACDTYEDESDMNRSLEVVRVRSKQLYDDVVNKMNTIKGIDVIKDEEIVELVDELEEELQVAVEDIDDKLTQDIQVEIIEENIEDIETYENNQDEALDDVSNEEELTEEIQEEVFEDDAINQEIVEESIEELIEDTIDDVEEIIEDDENEYVVIRDETLDELIENNKYFNEEENKEELEEIDPVKQAVSDKALDTLKGWLLPEGDDK